MTGLVEFLVNVEIDTGDLDTATLDELRAEEARRARELAADGSIYALWRIEGRWANAGIWRAPDENALLRKLDSLPLRPYMRIEWARLTEHPSDPRLTREGDMTVKSARGRIPLDPLPSLNLRRRGGSVRRGRTELAALPVLQVRARGERRTALPAAASTRACCESSAVRPEGGPGGVWCVRSQGGGSPQYWTYWGDPDNAASVRDRRRQAGGTFATRPSLLSLEFCSDV
ncbi:muconolactone Delta-isomerase family protein [Streptomyces sp. NPDC094034]|uniref:muconolactone Delta-isomerase family protein n=1 Tax=Streptomyces sp. NPDC094034 TaxID=3155309 RepID=UPI0033257FF1